MLTATLIIGVVVSLLLTELVGLTPGGIIVPGYVALLLDRPTVDAIIRAAHAAQMTVTGHIPNGLTILEGNVTGTTGAEFQIALAGLHTPLAGDFNL